MRTPEIVIIGAALLLVVASGLILLNFRRKLPANARQAPAKSAPGCVYADLSPCLTFQWLDDDPQRFKAVGWLAKNQPYQRGKPDLASFQKLHALLADPWSPVCLPHRTDCPFCPIINPDHGKKRQPWWAMQRGEADGLDLIHLRTPETLAHVETYCLLRSGASVPFESTNLFVPGDDCIYVAHAMIAHFVDAHGYAPPAEFWEAVRKCPVMNSLAYLEALILNGPKNKMWAAAAWAGSILKYPEEER